MRDKWSTVVYDLATGSRRKLSDGGLFQLSFTADGKTMFAVLVEQDGQARKSTLKRIDLASGKELGSLDCPQKGKQISLGQISPNGEIVAVWIGPVNRTKGDPIEVWFRDANTMAERGKLIGKGDPDRYGLGTGLFTPDGSRYIAVDCLGNAFVWNLAHQKVERTLQTGGGWFPWPPKISPDGKTLAVAWSPPPRPGASFQDYFLADPLDLPQPRISLVDLAGNSAPRTLIAPHGTVGGLAFSPDGKTLAFGSSGAVHLFECGKEATP